MRTFLASLLILSLSGCSLWGVWRIDPNHVLIRSDKIQSLEQEQQILAKAKLTWSTDQRIRVLYVSGTPYERGYQQGKLLRREVRDNLQYIYRRALQKFRSEVLFEEAYERMRPFIPQEYVDEMEGLAHGSRLPLHLIHHIHVLADIGEWGGKKRLGKLLKQMMADDLATTCSNLSIDRSASADGNMYTVRILDWGLHRISKLHEYPLILVSVPDHGIPNATITWAGYLGAVSGINSAGITLGEMGYRDPPNETLNGIPMPFMLREVNNRAKSLADVRTIIKDAVGTNSYLFLMSDGKVRDAEMYVKDRDRFLVFRPGQEVSDEKEHLPAIKDVVYGGRYNDRLSAELVGNHGKITPEMLMERLIPYFAMPSNFQNVIYDPIHLRFWVSNAANKSVPASASPYSFFDLKSGLEDFCSSISCPEHTAGH